MIKISDDTTMTNYVYAIAVDETTVKIGITSNIPKRMVMLQTAHPTQLIVKGVIRCKTATESRTKERALHEKYTDKRVRGEWFKFENIQDLLDEEGFVPWVVAAKKKKEETPMDPDRVSYDPAWCHFPKHTGTHYQCRLCSDRKEGAERRVTSPVKCELCNVHLCIKPPEDDIEADTCFKIWHMTPDPYRHSRHHGTADHKLNYKRGRMKYDGTDGTQRETQLRDIGSKRRKRT